MHEGVFNNRENTIWKDGALADFSKNLHKLTDGYQTIPEKIAYAAHCNQVAAMRKNSSNLVYVSDSDIANKIKGRQQSPENKVYKLNRTYTVEANALARPFTLKIECAELLSFRQDMFIFTSLYGKNNHRIMPEGFYNCGWGYAPYPEEWLQGGPRKYPEVKQKLLRPVSSMCAGIINEGIQNLRKGRQTNPEAMEAAKQIIADCTNIIAKEVAPNYRSLHGGQELWSQIFSEILIGIYVSP